MNRNLLIFALIFAGCALAGHSLLKPEPIRWQLNSTQQQVTQTLRLEKIPHYKPLNRLVIFVKPIKNVTSTQEHFFNIRVFCEGNDTPLKEQQFSTYPAASGGKFIVQLPDELEQCFNDEAIAQLKVNLSITPQTKDIIKEAILRKGEFYIE